MPPILDHYSFLLESVTQKLTMHTDFKARAALTKDAPSSPSFRVVTEKEILVDNVIQRIYPQTQTVSVGP